MTHKKYRNATIKLIIGVILLGVSRAYLNQHPAEKASLLSGMDVLRHRAHVRVASVQGKNTDHIQAQYKISRYMGEMLYTAQHTSGCEKGTLLEDIHQAIRDVDEKNATEVANNSSIYRNMIREWEMVIQKHCE